MYWYKYNSIMAKKRTTTQLASQKLASQTKTQKLDSKTDTKTGIDFQKQFAALETITEDFESGKYNLETGLKKFEEGLHIAQELKKHLESVENRIQTIKGKYYELTQEDE